MRNGRRYSQLVAKKLLSTTGLVCLLLVGAFSTYAILRQEVTVSHDTASKINAAGSYEKCLNQANCPAACVAPNCHIDIDPVTGQISCSPQGGSAGLSGAGGVIGSCGGWSLKSCPDNNLPCGYTSIPICYPVQASCVGQCVITLPAGGPRGCP